jgi:hypothetical protein
VCSNTVTLYFQTTIEFYSAQTKRNVLKGRGVVCTVCLCLRACNIVTVQVYRNPNDFGWRRNWQQVFGPYPILLSVLPSFRLPPRPERREDVLEEGTEAPVRSSGLLTHRDSAVNVADV